MRVKEVSASIWLLTDIHRGQQTGMAKLDFGSQIGGRDSGAMETNEE